MNALFTLKLFTTSHCHLCELAYALVSQYASEHKLECVEIIHDAQLLSDYGIRIPVLQRSDNLTELNWPFSSEDILRFIQA